MTVSTRLGVVIRILDTMSSELSSLADLTDPNVSIDDVAVLSDSACEIATMCAALRTVRKRHEPGGQEQPSGD